MDDDKDAVMTASDTALPEMVNAGVTGVLNTWGGLEKCAPLRWCLDASWSSIIVTGTLPDGVADHEVPAALEAWREFLALDEVDPATVKGTRQFTALTGAVRVTVWGVIDSDEFHADAAAWTDDTAARHMAAGQ